MKRFFTLIILLVLIACDEGLIITVPNQSSFPFTMLASAVNSDPDNVSTVSQEVDVSQFFNENSEQIESIKLNKLIYEISGYENTSGNLVLMDLTIQTRLDGNTNDILVLTGLVVENTGQVIAYEDGNPESALSAAQVASLESIMDNVQPFEMIVTGDFTDNIDNDFDLSISWDI